MGEQLKRGERTIRELVIFNEEEVTDEKLERRRKMLEQQREDIEAMMNEITMPGPAYCAAALPVRTKIPAPMMAPMPSVVRLSGPRARFRP